MLDFVIQGSDHKGVRQWSGATGMTNMRNQGHSTNSSQREKVIEHLFVGELLRYLWCEGVHDVEVLKAEVDNSGYDLVIEANGVMRHIQFKSSFLGAKTARVGINLSLANKPSACVIWIWFDPETLELGPFGWFGGDPGEPLPPLGVRVGRHSKGNRDGEKGLRPQIRELNKGKFTILNRVGDVAARLFRTDGISSRTESQEISARQ